MVANRNFLIKSIYALIKTFINQAKLNDLLCRKELIILNGDMFGWHYYAEKIEADVVLLIDKHSTKDNG